MGRQHRTKTLFLTPRQPIAARLGLVLFLTLLLTSFSFSFSLIPAHAASLRADNPLARNFAYCAGRLSAEAQDHQDRELLALKSAMQELLSAVIAPEAAPAYEELRIAGHVAQSQLLAAARFSFDEDEAARARELAADHLRQCRAMLLGQ
ncbi:hypothetical protein [Celeribacter neptunius]|uniref:Uncharacterized protein n=1 Tax=Celeribacter neptunius TaxID=588602 RepID=A0A1I3P6Z8_9RHOB|nr:hypothetical protein [Celeribacter neptunius]SFJ17334.1 hypothetical protein SAMN04487991_1585 [Celeribacter neptunius]